KHRRVRPEDVGILQSPDRAPVRSEPPCRRQVPAGVQRRDVERHEGRGADGHLGARRRDHAGLNPGVSVIIGLGPPSCATGTGRRPADVRVPTPTTIQKAPMILYDTKLSISRAFTSMATTLRAAPYTIARASGRAS